MTREIKFRGKATNTLYNGAEVLHMKGDWLYGDLIHQDGEVFIAPVDIRYPLGTSYTSFRVQADTVGQFTGLKDKNGVEIYEGDIIELDGIDETTSVVTYRRAAFGYTVGFMRSFIPLAHMEEVEGDGKVNWVVIGNIHDNPDLLKSDDEVNFAIKQLKGGE